MCLLHYLIISSPPINSVLLIQISNTRNYREFGLPSRELPISSLSEPHTKYSAVRPLNPCISSPPIQQCFALIQTSNTHTLEPSVCPVESYLSPHLSIRTTHQVLSSRTIASVYCIATLQFRMRNCGVPNPIYLVEEYGDASHLKLTQRTLEQAVTNTQVQRLC